MTDPYKPLQTPPSPEAQVSSTYSSEVKEAWAHMPRRALLGAAAAVLVGAGVATAWMRGRTSHTPTVSSVVPAFWSLKWNTPSGAELTMLSFKGRPLLINFWATWCPPCVEELPLIDAFFKENQSNGWQVLGLAVDKPAQVQTFLRKTPLAFSVAMAGFDGTGLSRSLGNTTGGLPFSVALDSEGGLIQRKMGRLDVSDLDLLRGLK
jgi:thiol-disulfide isomerase/thioredoxin